jgi:diguanylate cyclase (GGDEF)-like protein/PAS domain S-box-containing protein
MGRFLPYSLSDLPRLLAVACLYAVMANIMLAFFSADGNGAFVWFPSGLGLGALLLGGPKYWPGVFLGAFAAGHLVGDPPWASASIALGNTLEPMFCVWLLRRNPRFSLSLSHPKDYLWLLATGAASACLSALLGPAALIGAGLAPEDILAPMLIRWWMADLFGIALLTPFLLIWRRPPCGWLTRRRAPEAAALLALSFLSGQAVFLDWFDAYIGPVALAYWMFLFVVWGAARFGRHSVALLLITTSVQALWGVAQHKGFFNMDLAQTGLLNFWFYMLTLSSVGFMLALSIHARQRSLEALQETEGRFRHLLQSIHSVVWSASLSGEQVFYINPAVEAIYGRKMQAFYDNPSLWLEAVHPEDKARVAAKAKRLLEEGSQEAEYRILRPDGEIRWLHDRSYVICDAQGVATRIGGIATDITARKQAERLLLDKLEAEERLSTILATAPGVVCSYRVGADGKHSMPYASPAFEALYGLKPETVRDDAAPLYAWVAPEDYAHLQASIQESARTLAPWRDEWRMRHPSKGEIWLEGYSLPSRQIDGSIIWHGFVHDITDRKRSEAELRLAAKVLENSHEAILVADAALKILAVNATFSLVTGYALDEVIGKNPKVLASGKHSPEFYQAMWEAINSQGHWQGEIWNRRKNGEIYPEWLSISAVKNTQGATTHYLAIFSDTSENKATEAKIRHLAYHDPLTSLPNRQLLQDRAQQALIEAARHKQEMALLFVDLDRFKNINDTLGHVSGDQLLCQVAERLCGCVREVDTVGRLGGDEFLIILGDLHEATNAGHVAQKIIGRMETPFDLGGHHFTISPSIGVSIYPHDGESFQALLQKADIAMYEAKQAGRNAYRFFSEEINRASLEKLLLESHLRKALEHHEFSVHYQAQFDLASGQIVGAEALIRWRHPDLGPISPAQFIPLAEETGLIIPIGAWVLQEACRQNRLWQDAGHPAITMAVNLSVLQFQRGDILETVASVLAQTGMPAPYLELELTESILLQNAEKTMEALQKIKSLGVKLSIDDFGTGYSSLAYLKRLAVDKLKIDQSFVHDLTTDADTGAIVTAIIQMARGLSLKTIAEGVETPAQADSLKRQGCEEAQGYLYARPVPAEQFWRL